MLNATLKGKKLDFHQNSRIHVYSQAHSGIVSLELTIRLKYCFSLSWCFVLQHG